MIDHTREQKYERAIVWLLIGIYFAVFAAISVRKYNAFEYLDFDLAHHAQVLWGINHGSLRGSILGINFLGNHLHLILFLLAPIYAVLPHPVTLLILQTAFLAAAAYPLYLICREKLGSLFAVVFATVYLLYPGLGYTNLYEFHPTALATFFLMWMLFFFHRGNFRAFVVFMLLSLLCQENISLLVLATGIYAALTRRSWRWIAVPAVTGGIWFFAAIKLISFFAEGKIEFTAALYGHLGKSLGDILKNIAGHPLLILAYMFSPKKIIYLVKLFLPVAFFPLADPASFFTILPAAAQHLLSRRVTDLSINYHYTAEMIPFIFFSACLGARRLLRCLGGERKWKATVLALLFLLSAAAANLKLGPHFRLFSYAAKCRPDYVDRIKTDLLKQVPPDAGVIATFEFLPHLTNRRTLCSFHHVTMGVYTLSHLPYLVPEEVEYALIDLNDTLTFSSFYGPDGGVKFRKFLNSGNWGVKEIKGNLSLWQKNSPNKFVLYEELKELPPDVVRVSVAGEDRAELVGYEVGDRFKRTEGIMPVSTCWRRLAGKNHEYGIFLGLIDRNGRLGSSNDTPFGYFIYPLGDWDGSEIVRINCRYPLPPGLAADQYRLGLGVVDYERVRLVELSTPFTGVLNADRRLFFLKTIELE